MSKKPEVLYNLKRDSGDQTSSDKQPKQTGPIASPPFYQHILLVVLISYFTYMLIGQDSVGVPMIAYSEFKTAVRDNQVAEVNLEGSHITGKYRHATYDKKSGSNSLQFMTNVPVFGDGDLLAELDSSGVIINVKNPTPSLWVSVILNIIPWLLIIGFFLYSRRLLGNGLGGRLSGFAGSKARKMLASDCDTRFTDVAGLEKAKQELQEIVHYLKSPDQFVQMGAKMPKGILMMGPPGCGKTLLARAIAGEAGVAFFSVNGSEFVEMFVGVGASRVRSMFAEARKVAPALIFIDEIDAVGRARGAGLGGGNDEREQTLNQILSEMDGFSRDEPVVVLAATNRPDVLDPALMRPGRFDRKLVLELPQRPARLAILKIHSKRTPLAANVNLPHIAAETVGFSGADLENLVNEAALRAVRKQRRVVNAEDFEKARDRIVLGAESRELLNPEEKERIAYHEAGHALIAWLLPTADPLKRITIIPHGRALGATEQIPNEDRHNYTENYLQDLIKIYLGGRCAERLVFDNVSSGAADDLKKATELARKMICQWGMNIALGPISFPTEEEHPFLGRDIAVAKNFSEHSSEAIDLEVRNLIKSSEEASFNLLKKHRAQLTRLATYLLANETIHEQEFSTVLDTEQLDAGDRVDINYNQVLEETVP